ncbi:hypothetical protein Tco_0167583 [Tanacetum coccineum]
MVEELVFTTIHFPSKVLLSRKGKVNEELVEGSENVEENVKDNSSPLRNDDNHTDPDTRLEPRSDKESLEVEVTAIAPPVNVNDGEEESPGDDYEPFVVHPRYQDDPHDDAHPERDNSPSMLGNQEQSDDFYFWTNSYAIDDDVIPNEKVSQELVDEISQTIDEAKLRKVVDEMLRQQCTSRDEHQYHIDQMQNFLKSDIVWESRLEILVLPFHLKPTPVV